MGLKVRGSLYVLKKAVEKGLMSKDEAIKTLDEMIKDGFRISTRIYTKFFEEMKKEYTRRRNYVKSIHTS